MAQANEQKERLEKKNVNLALKKLNDLTSYDACSCAQANNIGKMADNVNTN